jgi:AcrR family transcriptional regulator
MVQTLTPPGRRERNRASRRSSYLRVALRLATDEGLHAVTMQRLAAELDCAVGTVYTYFPSKSALVAEVQREAIGRLTASYAQLRAELDEAGAGPLAHVVAVGRFWIDIGRTYPQETRLLQLLMSHGEQALTDDDDVLRVLPAALEHLDIGRQAIETAFADAAHDAFARTITLAAALNGVLQIGRLARIAPEVLDGERLAAAALDTLLLGWGASRRDLADAHDTVDVLAARGPLARPIPESE